MFKLKINNFDILPFILGAIVLAMIIISELNTRGYIHLKGGLSYIIGYSIPIVMGLSVLNYVKKIRTPDGVDLSKLISTDDMRTPSFRYSGTVDRGTNISFIKLYFSEKEIYVYYRNFFPIKIYQGPFTIAKRDSFLSSAFILKEFERIGNNEAKLRIQSQNGLTSYTFQIRDISTKDFELMEDHLKQY